jgi:hypothetical protein
MVRTGGGCGAEKLDEYYRAEGREDPLRIEYEI